MPALFSGSYFSINTNKKLIHYQPPPNPSYIQKTPTIRVKVFLPIFSSEVREFTSSWSKVLKDDEKITIKILPQFLPHGEENRTKIEIGVRIGDDDESPLTAHFWRYL